MGESEGEGMVLARYLTRLVAVRGCASYMGCLRTAVLHLCTPSVL